MNDYINPFKLRNGVIHKSYEDWIAGIDGWDTAGTLTFQGHILSYEASIQRQLAEKSLCYYWNLLDKVLFGKAAERYGKRIDRLCFYQHQGRNIHIHFIAKLPDRVGNHDIFHRGMTDLWQDKITGAGSAVIKPVTDARGWGRYISRECHFETMDGLDEVASHINH